MPPSSAQSGGQNLGGLDLSVPISGGPAAPSWAASSATLNLSLPFSEAPLNVGGYQSAQQSPTLDGPAGTAPASGSISPLLLIAGALLIFFLVRHGSAA